MRFPLVLVFILSGILFGISFVFSFLFFCFLPAFALFLYGIQKEDSWVRLFFYGMLCGTLHYAGSFYWVWTTYPIQWFTNQPQSVQLLAIGTYWILTSLAMAISGGVFALCVKKLLKYTYVALLCVPLLWVGGEVLRSFLFSFYTLGEGGFLNFGFSYGYLGYLLSEVPLLLQLSFVAGVYGLSFLAALFGVTAFYFFAKGKYKQPIFAVSAVVLLSLIFVVPVVQVHPSEEIGKKVIVVETWFDRQFLSQENASDQKQREVEKAVALALREAPDVIIMPEDVRFANAFPGEAAFWEWMKMHAAKDDVLIIDNGPVQDARDERVLRSFMYDLKTQSVYFFDKRYLVPQGEFMSYLHMGILSLFVSKETKDHITEYARFVPGIIQDSVAYPDYVPGILFCFETMVPYGVLFAKQERKPDFIAHPISHAWFTNPFSLEYQLDQMLQVSAVWNDIPVVSAGSMTQSKLFLPTGDVHEGHLVQESEYWKLRVFEF